MNEELKPILKVLFDGEKAVQDGVQGKGSAVVMADVLALVTDIPALLQHISDIQAELLALNQSANVSDLLAFILAEFAGVSTDAHAQAILSASLNLIAHVIADSVALAAAIKGS